MAEKKQEPQTLKEKIAEMRAKAAFPWPQYNWALGDLEEWMKSVGPVMAANHYCEQFRIWEKVYLDSVDDNHVTRSDFSTVRLAIEKSCLLDRLIYGGEKLRTEKCPIHKGTWSGCHWDPCEFCHFGCNVTGWLRHDLTDEQKDKVSKLWSA